MLHLPGVHIFSYFHCKFKYFSNSNWPIRWFVLPFKSGSVHALDIVIIEAGSRFPPFSLASMVSSNKLLPVVAVYNMGRHRHCPLIILILSVGGTDSSTNHRACSLRQPTGPWLLKEVQILQFGCVLLQICSRQKRPENKYCNQAKNHSWSHSPIPQCLQGI